MWTEEDKKITGWDSPQEWQAYDIGRSDEMITIYKFIQEWDGRRNSALGNLMFTKMQELFTVVGNQWVRKDNQPLNTELIVRQE